MELLPIHITELTPYTVVRIILYGNKRFVKKVVKGRIQVEESSRHSNSAIVFGPLATVISNHPEEGYVKLGMEDRGGDGFFEIHMPYAYIESMYKIVSVELAPENNLMTDKTRMKLVPIKF